MEKNSLTPSKDHGDFVAACVCGDECPCHEKGTPMEGYVHAYTDDRNILHEDWTSCSCKRASSAPRDEVTT